MDFFYGSAANDFLIERAAEIIPGGRVLTLAEGEGRNAIFLAQQGFQVTAIDWSEVGLAKLTKWAEKEHLHIDTICADITAHDLGTSAWDAIVSIWFHLPSKDRIPLYRHYIQALKVDGVLILEAYNPNQLNFKTGGPADSDMLPTTAELKQNLALLHPVLATERERNINEGHGHNGRSAVVQYLGRKP